MANWKNELIGIFAVAFISACFLNSPIANAPPKQIDICDSCVLVQKDSCRMKWDKLCKENFKGFRKVCNIEGYCDPGPPPIKGI